MSMIHDIVSEQSGEIVTLRKRVEELEELLKPKSFTAMYTMMDARDHYRAALEEITKLAPVYQRAVAIATTALREKT